MIKYVVKLMRLTIKKVVEENHDKTVDFINTAEAEQYRESEMIRKRNNI